MRTFNKLFFVVCAFCQELFWYTDGVTRCFCNESYCVQTSYMCKSAHGTCYSLLAVDHSSGDSDTYTSLHGCADVFSHEEKETCKKNEEIGVIESAVRKPGYAGQLRLRCCRQDMCNYIDNVNNIAAANRSILSIIRGASGGTGTGRGMQHSNDVLLSHTTIQQKGDLWLRVTMILVPIIGACILVILMIIASRLLGIDCRRKHPQSHHHHYHLHNYKHSCRRPLVYDSASLTIGSLSAHCQSLLVTKFLNDRLPFTTTVIVPNINKWAETYTTQVSCVCCDTYSFARDDFSAISIGELRCEAPTISIQTDDINISITGQEVEKN